MGLQPQGLDLGQVSGLFGTAPDVIPAQMAGRDTQGRRQGPAAQIGPQTHHTAPQQDISQRHRELGLHCKNHLRTQRTAAGAERLA